MPRPGDRPWYATDEAADEGIVMWTWCPVHAVDVDGEAIGHAWRGVLGMAIDLGLMVKVPGSTDDPPPDFITLIPWHRIAWVRWQPRGAAE